MSEKYKRNFLFRVNRFQKKILVPIIACCLLGVSVSIGSLIYFYYLLYSPSNYRYLEVNEVAMSIPWVLTAFSLIMLTIVLWTYYISNKLFGPYERVIQELDDIIEGGGKKSIGTRQGDEMFEELLKRVNKIIERLP